MIQESVYGKLALNQTAAQIVKERVRKICPKHGLVQMLCVTEKQFAGMEFLCGTPQNVVVDSDRRLVML